MSEHDINQNEEADAASNMATIASKPTGISRSDLIAKMVAYASSLDKETLAQAAETIGMLPDDIYNNNAHLATGDNSVKNKASINSSNAAAAMPMTSVREDLELLFGDSTDLSEDFKLKINTLFEAAVSTRVSIETAKLEESFEEAASELQTQFETDLEESVEKIQSEMLENVDNYINYAVAEWISENTLAIESGIRTEIAESFMLNLKNVFEQHYIDIPEDKVDVVESMAAELEEIKSRLNETTERNIELSKVVNQKEVEDITTTFAEGMTDTQKDKFVKLTESINYSDSAEFRKKVSIIKETYFPTKSEVKVTEDQLLNESVEEPEKTPYVDPLMNSYVASISRTLKK
jgi:hypothetical protein